MQKHKLRGPKQWLEGFGSKYLHRIRVKKFCSAQTRGETDHPIEQ